MPDIDPIILQLRADVKQYQNEVRATTVLVSNQLDRQERSIASLEHHVERSSGRIASSFSAIKSSAVGLLAGVSAGALISELADLADTAKQIDAQLKLATNSFGTFGQAQEDVRRISADARAGLEDTASLYGSFARTSQEIGKTQSEAARATETFTKALKIGGAGTQQVQSATLQMGQALASTNVQWEELGQILEASPRLAKVFTDSLGVTRTELKQMASDGKLSGEMLFNALNDRKITAGIEAEFKQIPVTFGDAMQAMENAAITSFGEFDKGGRFSDAIVTFLGTGTDTFEGLTDKAGEFGRETRAVMDGLGNAFDPLEANGNAVFDALGIRIYTVREQVQSLLDSIDRLRNFDANIENGFKAGLNRAIDRAGGGQKFEMSPTSNLGGRFRTGARVSDARGRVDAAARRLEAAGFIVPRNADGSVNEAGIVRRPAATRPRATGSGGSTGGGGSGRRSTSGATRTDAGREAAQAAKDYEQLIAQINADLREGLSNTSDLITTESERLARSARFTRDILGREGEDYDDPFPDVKDYDRERDARIDAAEDAERQAQDVRMDNVRDLADLYGDLFTRRTGDVWRNFKEDGLRTVAFILAQATLTSFGKGGGGFSSLISNIGQAAGTYFGRASGGYVAPGQTVRVNEGASRGPELLRMGSQGGTVIPLGQTKAERPQATTQGAMTIRVELSEDLNAKIDSRGAMAAVEVIRASAPAIIDAATVSTVDRLRRPTL